MARGAAGIRTDRRLVVNVETGWRDSTVVASIVAGLLLLVAFVWAERHSPAPMMPLDLFRSRTFSGVNLLTLLLYAALGGGWSAGEQQVPLNAFPNWPP